MKIDIWSDFACPFCYIGKRRLEEALAQFPHRDHVEVTFRSFELDPNAPTHQQQSMDEMLAQKYGMSVEEARRMNDNVTEQAKAAGITFRLDKAQLTNTFTAHRLAQFAKAKGKGLALTEKLFQAYFTDGKHLSDEETLTEIAESIGLARDEVSDVLKDEGAFADEVRTDIAIAQQIGVRGVPFFVINNKYAISGAQAAETFLGALQKVWEEEHEQLQLKTLGDVGDNCADGNCAIPNKQ